MLELNQSSVIKNILSGDTKSQLHQHSKFLKIDSKISFSVS